MPINILFGGPFYLLIYFLEALCNAGKYNNNNDLADVNLVKTELKC